MVPPNTKYVEVLVLDLAPVCNRDEIGVKSQWLQKRLIASVLLPGEKNAPRLWTHSLMKKEEVLT
jgi:hypothetical protein